MLPLFFASHGAGKFPQLWIPNRMARGHRTWAFQDMSLWPQGPLGPQGEIEVRVRLELDALLCKGLSAGFLPDSYVMIPR